MTFKIKQNTYLYFTDDDFPALITKFQIALYRYHHSTDENFNSTLYDPSTMRLFANRHAPGLFDKILQSMEKNQINLHQRKDMQKISREQLHFYTFWHTAGKG